MIKAFSFLTVLMVFFLIACISHAEESSHAVACTLASGSCASDIEVRSDTVVTSPVDLVSGADDRYQGGSDADLDGVDDVSDNCTNVFNPDQTDSNGDGYGNACDADLNNDCVVNFLDISVFAAAFLTDDADADLNGPTGAPDGIVNFLDLIRFQTAFLEEPGPGLGSCGVCEPPPALGSNSDFAGLDMYFRGTLNGFVAQPGLNNFSDQTGGLYIARFEIEPGFYEWKIADDSFFVQYCTMTELVEGVTTNAPLDGCFFPANGTMTVQQSGCYEFQMQTDFNVPPLSVDITFVRVN